MSVTITVYGGAAEIGANKILVEDQGHDVRLLLDFGESFDILRRFYDFPMAPQGLEELLQIRAVPDLPNLYHRPDAQDSAPSDIDALILSHAHSDHSGYIPLLNRSIPIYMGDCTRCIFEARLQGARKHFDTDIEGQKIRTFKTGDKFRVGSVEIEPVHVDHSIPAAYGFIIHTSEATLVYTGDFRRHGARPQLTQDFVNAVKQAGPPDLVISEGTNFTRAEVSTEEEVQRKATGIIQGCRSLAFADFSEMDFDRFRTMHQVAEDSGRELVIEPRRMWVLQAINQCSGLAEPNVATDASIRMFDAEKTRLSSHERLLRGAGTKLPKLEERTVTPADIQTAPHQYLFCTSFGSISAIQRLKPPASGLYLLSASEPFNEESKISFDKLQNWLELSGLAMYSAHCSGHVHPLELRQTLEDMKPKTVLAVHTEKPLLFKRFIEPSGMTVQVPEPGVSFKVTA
jgi:ribonuclease J